MRLTCVACDRAAFFHWNVKSPPCFFLAVLFIVPTVIRQDSPAVEILDAGIVVFTEARAACDRAAFSHVRCKVMIDSADRTHLVIVAVTSIVTTQTP